MKKTIILTEDDLTRLVKRVIKEQEEEQPNRNYDDLLLIENKSTDEVSEMLNELSEGIKFLAILNCEYADVSNIDLCSFPNLIMVNLKGTPNNFEETQGNCYHDLSHGMYDFS